MNEELLRERLADAAIDDAPPVDAGPDLERGRTALRRRRRIVLGGSVAATAGVVAAAFVLAGLVSDGDPAGSGTAPIADQSTSNPTAAPAPPDEPKPTAAPDEPGPSMPSDYPSPTESADEGSKTVPPSGGEGAFDPTDIDALTPWRHDLYRLAQDVLDPKGGHLNYDTQSLQGGSSGKGYSYGIKLGWSAQGDSGEGLIALAIASPGATGLVSPCGYTGPCREVEVSGHGTIRIAGDPDDGEGYAVLLTQADGEEVSVVVDPLFGNNSLTPTATDLVGLERVLDLAESTSFNLPG